MSKNNVFASQLMKLIFNNTTAANIGDATGLVGSSSGGNLYVSLHTSTGPGESGDATTNETGYTGYSRVTTSRDGTSAWTVAGGDPDPASVSPAADIDFGECTAVPGVDLTYFGVSGGIGASDNLLYAGTLTPNIVMAIGVIPRIKTTSTITED